MDVERNSEPIIRLSNLRIWTWGDTWANCPSPFGHFWVIVLKRYGRVMCINFCATTKKRPIDSLACDQMYCYDYFNVVLGIRRQMRQMHFPAGLPSETHIFQCRSINQDKNENDHRAYHFEIIIIIRRAFELQHR